MEIVKLSLNAPPYKMFLLISLYLTFFGSCCGETNDNLTDVIEVSSSIATLPSFMTSPFTKLIHSTASSVKPLGTTEPLSTATPTTKESVKTTKEYATEYPTTSQKVTTQEYVNTRSTLKSSKTPKLSNTNSTSHSITQLQDRLGAIDCDLPVLPRESRLWRGNETHELNLPVTECVGERNRGEEECSSVIVSWEGVAAIQSGDILIVRIADSSSIVIYNSKNETLDANSSHTAEKRSHISVQPAVYQVTRQGHEHCDVSDGMLLDITPLDEHGAKIFTLYDKDLTEGVNLLIVVSENWGSQCVRLKVTVKSDNCGESQECSGKGVCYTNVSMEGYECQCCRGYVGSHCEDREVCNPSPCLNNGICVDLTQPSNGATYHCLCPYGFTGRKCEKDPCYSAPCLNGGSCMSMAMNGSTTFHCACTDDWTGAHCEIPATGGVCASKPCVKGICIEQIDGDVDDVKYRCFCEPGYTGDRCELEYNECESSPCGNGGSCTDRVGGYDCSCTRGYTGDNCQLKVDLCSPNPCPTHRYCMDHGSSYTCECPSGFVGEECHIPATSACDNNPCAHGGTCWSGVDSFYCSCRPGYTGKLCEEDFILESVMDESEREEQTGGGSVREMRLPLGLYHDRLHNVYIAAGTLGAAIAIVGVVVTACHCRVNKTYSRLMSRLSRVTESGPPHHWLEDKRAPPAPLPPALDTTDMYYTLDFSDSQSSPLIQ
ncbi:delta and Notch-like epidermal growth factor-related receptor [Danaus plexippus]|uniref:delta and Notch-like epidermal growth factor-related receptor n=1 Tax=Danaus plexippus TaxID=13037 RepID=UPI002AB09775|nr:delta and Notch-like epidermal growth factor-related receptor [Danaus plexippus]XP_061385877.1 delta and Notch-like epidermal growth factor-related receptor [Danaus plexippus]